MALRIPSLSRIPAAVLWLAVLGLLVLVATAVLSRGANMARSAVSA